MNVPFFIKSLTKYLRPCSECRFKLHPTEQYCFQKLRPFLFENVRTVLDTINCFRVDTIKNDRVILCLHNGV